MLAAGVLLLISVFASKTSTKYGIPILLIFIGVGLFAGSEGPGGLHFDNPRLTQILGTISLVFILFSGGLSTDLRSVKPVWREGLTLAFLGVILSTGVMSVLIHYVLGWSWITAALLSATISSTDASAVFGILKTQKLRLKENIQSIIELESGSNDPMAVFLTLTLIQLYLKPELFSFTHLLMEFFIQMSLGGLAGWFLGKSLAHMINWLDLEFEGLYPVLTTSGVICIYSLTEYCGGNGFLSVYVAGLAMGGEKYFSKKTLTVFHDGLAWLMQVAMFLTLGLLVFPSEIMPTLSQGLFVSLALLLIARPISVFLCLYWFKFRAREIMFISWGGLRGAVPIILAIYLLVSGVPEARIIFNLVFFMVIFSMLIQGTTLKYFSKKFRVQDFFKPTRKLAFNSRNHKRDFVEFEVGTFSPLLRKTIVEINFPIPVLVVLIHRRDHDFIPRGNTEIHLYDKLVCLIELEHLAEFERFLGITHEDPLLT